MGLWSRFWSVVPKAVVKSARDAVSKPDAPRSTPTSGDESTSVTEAADEVIPSEETEKSVPSEVTDDGDSDGEAPPGPRQRTL